MKSREEDGHLLNKVEEDGSDMQPIAHILMDITANMMKRTNNEVKKNAHTTLSYDTFPFLLQCAVWI